MPFVKGKTGNSTTDKVYTPSAIAKSIIDKFELSGKVLDPFKGQGAFYDNLPDGIEKDWCEIDEDRDFFAYDEHVDWIISNPPYSIYKEVMTYSFEIADNIVYLIPLSKLVSSLGRIREIKHYGGIPYIWIIGGGSKCGFPFGFPVCAVHFKRGYKGPITVEVEE